MRRLNWLLPLAVFFLLNATPGFGYADAGEIAQRMAGKWQGPGTRDGQPGCGIRFSLVPGSQGAAAAVQYQIQCPGYQSQNQFSVADSAFADNGFTDRRSTTFFGVVETTTLRVQLEEADALSFDLKVEKSGTTQSVRGTLVRDPL